MLLIIAVVKLPAAASCNLIPQAQRSFRSALGATDRPYATPGDFVELSVRPAVCDAASPGFGSDPDDYVVTLIFEPPNSGPRRVLVVTTDSCASPATDAKVQACGLTPGVTSADCLQVSSAMAPIGLTVVQRQGENRLAFRFPDTDALFTPDGDDRTLSGPVTIAVSNVADAALPCGLATSSCAAQSGLVACVDDLYTADGTCAPNVDPIYGRFTALPHPNSYQFDCFEDAPPCNPLATELRATLDNAGNLLLPFNWQGIILRPDGNPVPRLLRATIKSPLPFTIPSEAFVDSYTPEGGKLPPIFEPQFDPTVVADDVVTLFGSADAPATVLRIARHRGICDGGSNDGQPCAVSTDCGGGTCDDACAGGSNDGLACTGPGDCPGGLCGSLFNASFFQLLTTSGGPLTLERVASGINGICQKPPHEECSNTVPCPGISNPCVRFSFQAQDPVPLEGLTGSESIFSFVLNEAVDLRDRNGDGDMIDQVVTLRDRVTGDSQALGAPAGCGIAGTPEGRAVLPVFQDPFQFPALATENDTVAFLELELSSMQCDLNGNGVLSDPILRVFRLGASELTGALSPPRTVDAAPLVDGKSLAISEGLVFYRRSETAQAQTVTEQVDVSSAEVPGNDSADLQSALSRDGSFVVFGSAASNLVPEASTFGTRLYLRDVALGTTELISVSSTGALANAHVSSPSVSDDGRFVAFWSLATNLVTGDTNGAVDVFLRDRETDTTSRVSVQTGGAQSGGAGTPVISGDGSVVIFTSDASDLVSGDTNTVSDVFAHDHASVTTTRVSVATGGGQANGASSFPAVSANGRYVAFQSSATNLVSGVSGTQIYVRDLESDATDVVSVASDGSVGDDASIWPSISADGRYVSFTSIATNLVYGDPDFGFNVYVHDRQTGITERLTDLGGTGSGASNVRSSISEDGRFVGTESSGIYDRRTGVTTNFPGQYGVLSANGRAVVYRVDDAVDSLWIRTVDEGDVTADVFPDGQLVDRVLEVFDTSTSSATTLCPAEDVVVAAGMAAFLRPESNSGTAACPSGSLNSDGDIADNVVHLWSGAGTAQSLGIAATALAMSSTHIAALVPEAGENNSILNGDGDTEDTVVHVHPAGAGSWTNVMQAADSVSVCGSIVVFTTPEAAEGSILNGDGDQLDRVIQVYNPANGALINVGQAAEEFVCSSDLVAFRTSEAAQDSNLNIGAGDIDSTDYVIQVYDIGRTECVAMGAPADCLSNSHNSVRTCQLAACDPRVPYTADADTAKFIAYECDDGGTVTNGCAGGGTDHSGNLPPFAGDLVIRVYNVRTNTTRTIGRISGADPVSSGGARGTGAPLQDGSSPGSSTDNGTVYQSVGRCIEIIGGVCSGNADCGPAEFCDESTCKREQRVCATDADCTGGVTCETTNGAGIVPASPDTDGDGVPDHLDNCIYLANAAQTDVDFDRVGDLCDLAVCGNAILDAGEQCDGSAGACPGSCQTNCVCGPTPTRTRTRTPTRTPTGGPPPLPGTPTITPTRTPTRTPTSSPTAPLTCGNNIVEGVEQCDGTADGACPGGCLGNCVCAVCGDEVVNGPEQCDGDNDSLCPGACDEECLCTGSVCGDNLVAEDEDCDGTDDFACPGQCDSECACPEPDEFFDSVVLPRSALKVVIGEGKTEITKTLKVKVLNGDWPEDEPGPHEIRLIAQDGTCPPGTVLGVDFDGRTAGYQPSIVLNPFKSKGGSVALHFASADFTTPNHSAPARCTLDFRVITEGVINEDPDPSNDRVRVDVNVYDKNDAEQSVTATTHESVLKSQKAINIIIPLDLEDYKNKSATVKVINADILPAPEAPGHPIDLDVDENDCPPGTVSVITSVPVMPFGGKSAAIKLLLRAHPDDFETLSKKSPSRCTVKLTATTTTPGNVEPHAGNNVTDLVINVYDKNDIAP